MAQQDGSNSEPVLIERLSEKPFDLVLAYPKPDPCSVSNRIEQLETLGVRSIIFRGPSKINRTAILGKGCVGVVVEAQTNDHRNVALKIRRTDANRPSMKVEAEYQKRANEAGIGSILKGETDDILLMDLVEGETLPRWLSGVPPVPYVRSALRLLLEQCHTLDKIGLDHGELSHAHKNVLVAEGNLPIILDFESSSTTRRPHNVTSVVQYLIFSGKISSITRDALGLDKGLLLERLKTYKTGKDRNLFDSVLSSMKL